MSQLDLPLEGSVPEGPEVLSLSPEGRQRLLAIMADAIAAAAIAKGTTARPPVEQSEASNE